MSRSGPPDTTRPDPVLIFTPQDPPRTGELHLDGTPVPLLDALPDLVARDDVWGAVTALALDVVARGALVPGVSPAGFDAWAADLDDADDVRLRRLAADDPGDLRAFCDAVADTLPRSGDDHGAYAGNDVVRLGRDGTAQGTTEAVRLSLRIESGAADALDGPADAVDTDSGTGAAGAGSRPVVRAVLQVHASGLVTDAAALWEGPVSGFAPRHRVVTALALRRAAQLWPPLERLLSAAVPGALDLDDTDLADLLASGVAALASGGVAVHWPRGLRDGLRPRIVAGREDDGAGAGLLDGTGSVALDWQLALRGDPLTVSEYETLASAASPLVRLRDEWVLVDPATARRAARSGGPEQVPAVRAIAAALAGELLVDGVAVPVTAQGGLERLRDVLASAPEALPEPPGLAAELRAYQRQGLGWLARMVDAGLGGCLADDMGLGKTITVIALHLHRRTLVEGDTLVVCPASVMPNWEREIRRFAPGVPVTRFHGAGRSAGVGTGGILLTTYGTLRADPEPLAGRHWDLVVADEAQYVKNARSDTAHALRTVPATARVALSGTPVQNRLADLWAILDWTTPGLLGGRTEFARRWSDPIESADPGTAAAATDRLARLVGPFLLRRRKTDPGVAPDLPARTVTDRPVGLTREQAGLYTAALDAATGELAGRAGVARHGAIGALLTALKQICNHPAHYLGESGDDVVLDGRSGKLDALDALLDRILDADERTLVFTQYVTMAQLLELHLRRRGTDAAILHGGLTLAARTALVDRFQAGELPVLLLSLTAAGTGLNLTRADHVVHYDRWWNPAVEDQATDRAHRIGRVRPVHVHRLVAEGTLEDRIAALLERKRALSDSVLARGEDALTGLSDDQLAELVALTAEPADGSDLAGSAAGVSR
ncbi:helicase-like protein [Pseudonocardia sediminis]|uniref:Helicase-like protein n=1 Tax=Pseudonocardia sediminis TaxID=1397368 RepID=A0A4Q7UWU8_PSEST|nr:DEAD/DEAH box helicase [Pseudonocardia sediminis]RZT86452.1 helicase-like protein [Pseudonocardia sediminis]